MERAIEIEREKSERTSEREKEREMGEEERE